MHVSQSNPNPNLSQTHRMLQQTFLGSSCISNLKLIFSSLHLHNQERKRWSRPCQISEAANTKIFVSPEREWRITFPCETLTASMQRMATFLLAFSWFDHKPFFPLGSVSSISKQQPFAEKYICLYLINGFSVSFAMDLQIKYIRLVFFCSLLLILYEDLWCFCYHQWCRDSPLLPFHIFNSQFPVIIRSNCHLCLTLTKWSK